MNASVRRFLTIPALASVLPGLFLMALVACNDRPQSGQAASMPKAPIPAVEAQSGAGKLQIDVEIPPSHHAYLDSGKDGNFIPLDFDWKKLGDVSKPRLVGRPKGEYEPEAKVHVLRGRGRFSFSHPRAESLKGKKVGVRTQICNDDTGICYRPTTKDVTIQ